MRASFATKRYYHQAYDKPINANIVIKLQSVTSLFHTESNYSRITQVYNKRTQQPYNVLEQNSYIKQAHHRHSSIDLSSETLANNPKCQEEAEAVAEAEAAITFAAADEAEAATTEEEEDEAAIPTAAAVVVVVVVISEAVEEAAIFEAAEEEAASAAAATCRELI